jgi:hypothetical protein
MLCTYICISTYIHYNCSSAFAREAFQATREHRDIIHASDFKRKLSTLIKYFMWSQLSMVLTPRSESWNLKIASEHIKTPDIYSQLYFQVIIMRYFAYWLNKPCTWYHLTAVPSNSSGVFWSDLLMAAAYFTIPRRDGILSRDCLLQGFNPQSCTHEWTSV